MPTTSLTDLPPELLDNIIPYLPSAQSLASLGQTDKKLHAFVERDGWRIFNRDRFPSLHPVHSPSHKDAARTLATLSRAWHRRAFVATSIEPHGKISVFPEGVQVDKWKRPRGQSIGFAPQLDCYEQIGPRWRDRSEVLAFSAGAEVCVRDRKTGSHREDVRWSTYRPSRAVEGRNDITSLHLVRRASQGEDEREGMNDSHEIIMGTANGDLQLLSIPYRCKADAGVLIASQFATQSLPVRSSSLLHYQCHPALLAANIGDTRVSLYPVDLDSSGPSTLTVDPTSSVDTTPLSNGHRATQRVWSTTFLSDTALAVGLGPAEEAIHVYTLTPSGLDKSAHRKFRLSNDAYESSNNTPVKTPISSVYPIIPLPSSSSASAGAQVFLSGAYDGTVRLHDLRAPPPVQLLYGDLDGDGAIYSLLARGREKLLAGTARHSLLKVFDLRLGARAYSYLDASSSRDPQSHRALADDWSIFLKPHAATYPGRGGGNNWARRSAESSVYSLAASSPHSPFVYAGVENAALALAWTSVSDPRPDPLVAAAASPSRDVRVLDLAMTNESADGLKLYVQRGLKETARAAAQRRTRDGGQTLGLSELDERWKIGGLD